MRAFEEFLLYKTRVPVRGVILLNAEMDSVVLVKGWKKGANWSFPRGKINKDEDDLTCAIREAYEETGYDLAESGLVAQDRSLVKGIDVTGHGQQIRLYVFRDVPMDTPFEPQTRKEISRIQWWRLSDLPAYRKKGQQQHQPEAAANANKFYMVAPFLPPLKKWILDQKKKDSRWAANQHLETAGNFSHDEGITEDDQPVEPSINVNSSASHEAEQIRRDAADLALSAIMQVQPPTQGLQPDAINPAPSQVSHSSGQQLLALLHSKPPADQVAPAQLPPQTPIDQTTIQPTFPRTPHHQIPHSSYVSNQQPPPTFPLKSQQQEHRPMQTYSYQQPEIRTRLDQRSVPNMQYRHQMPQQMPQQVSQQIQHRFSHQLPQQMSQRIPQHIPQYIPPQMLNHIPQHMMQQLPQQRERHSFQPPLIHPQPLPPNAQKVLFTGAPVHSTMVPQPVQQPVHHNFATTGAMPLPQFPNVHAPMVPPEQKEAPAALTSHKLSLLNALKTHNQVNGNSASNQLPPQNSTQSHVKVSLHEAQELPGESSRSIPVSVPTEVAQSSKFVSGPNAGFPSTVDHDQTARPPISEHHRSTLLGIFKSPAAQPATLASAPAAVALPTSGSPSAVELSAVEIISAPPILQQTVTNDDDSGAIHDIPEMNPELSLPFRATSILTRPRNGHKETKPYGSLSKKPVTRPGVHNNSKVASKASPEKPFQPQILKRPQAHSVRASPLLAPSTIAAYSPNLSQPSIAGPSTSPLSFTSQAPRSTEQKHALLSLFGKSPVAVPSSISRTSSRDGTASNPLIDATRGAASRSRVGSLASGNGDGMSRRGSQAPISPADKGFLLNYLDAVANRGY